MRASPTAQRSEGAFPGRFITLEGSEGAGKTTQLAALQALLSSKKIPVMATREPGGTPVAEAVREILLNPKHRGMHCQAELLLVFAARAQHLQEKIIPALKRGQWVLCDRFTDATYAYQGAGRGIDLEPIAALEQWVQEDLRPDLTVVLDLPVGTGLARAGKPQTAADRFEQEPEDFFERVRGAYLARAKAAPHRYQVVDASGPVRRVTEKIMQGLKERLL